jgi:hypothetical protein
LEQDGELLGKGDNEMTRTPDESKKGLECCMMSTCEPSCPYDNPVDCGFAVQLLQDTFALIQQLEADNAKKDETIQMLQDGNASLMRMIDEEREKTVKLEAELDAMKDEIDRDCETCKHCESCQEDGYCMWCENKESNKTPCCNCVYGCNWEWRGVQKD